MLEKKPREVPTWDPHGHKAIDYFKDAALYIAGALLYALSVDMFTSPNSIAPGGVTGISTMINHTLGFPIGATMVVLNIPIFIIGGIVIGWKYIGRTFVCLVLCSLAIDVMEQFVPVYTGDKLLAALFGGVLMGLALGLIFARGGSTGGSDVIARVLGRLFRSATQGNIIMGIDLLVIGASALVFGLESGLYALIALFVSSFTLDKVLYGVDTGRVMLIVSEKTEEINSFIISRMVRGTTLLQARGGYSGNEHEVIMCAVRRNEVFQLRAKIKQIDSKAFIIVCEASEVLGLGFKPVGQDEFGDNSY